MDTGSSVPFLVGLALLLAGSAFFSACETAYSSLNLVRLKSMVAAGDKGAEKAFSLSQKYDKLLSTVLIGNNIVNIASSALATVLFVGWFGNFGVTLATIVMTVLVLLFGEISPKTLAKETPERFAIQSAPILQVFVVVFTPLNAFFSAWKRLLLKIFKISGGANMTEEELLAYVSEAREEGGINENEEDLIRQVIEFDDLDAGEILTPRVDITAVAEDDPVAGIAMVFHETGYSRLPVYGRSLDDIKGVLLQKDFSYLVQQRGHPVENVMKPVIFAAKQVKISKLLEQLQQKKTHMAIIVDEHGGTLGLVTIEDILEELVGEIWDEHDEVIEQIIEEGKGSYRVLGSTDIEDLFELLSIEDQEIDSSTVGGWVVETLGRFPEDGEEMQVGDAEITVTKTVRQRVLEILVKLPLTSEPETDDK